MYSKLFGFLLVLVSGVWFMLDSNQNYAQHVEVRRVLVNHPEFIPSSASVRLSSGWFDNIVADFYWLSAIQYIGSNAINGEYKRYLYRMLDLVTDLNPHFVYPYEIGELLLPSSNERYEHFSEAEIKKNVDEWYTIGMKWLVKNCDAKKIERIKSEVDLKKLWSDPAYRDPCSDPMIPYYLGYISYWDMHDAGKSSEFYKIASANQDAPKGARTMAAIMQGKTGDREKAIIMFLSLAEGITWEKHSLCSSVSNELWDLLLKVKKEDINGKFLAEVEFMRREVVKRLQEDGMDPSKTGDAENFCSTYLNKAVREMNLGYLEVADARYFADKKVHASNPEVLLSNKYIDYIPLDFQRDKQEGIVYFYNDEISGWDYRMQELMQQ